MKKILIVVSHPIQYHIPIWKAFNDNTNIDSEVLFHSNHGQVNSFDKDFGISFKWDIPLTKGYKFSIYRNLKLPFSQKISLGVLKKLATTNYDAVYFHGFSSLTNLLGMIIVKLRSKKVILRNISYVFEKPNRVKYWIICKLLKMFDLSLYIGDLNRRYYQFYNVPSHKLRYAPHLVDNDFFEQKYLQTKNNIKDLKKKYNIPQKNNVFLFCGKFIDKKQPLLLQKAFNAINPSDWSLLFVGDGKYKDELRAQMNDNTRIIGFLNQSEIHEAYSIADVLVLPSQFGETWGLVVNEALNFGCATLVSDRVGCFPELVVKSQTGLVFDHSSYEDLKNKLKEFVCISNTHLNKYKDNGIHNIKSFEPSILINEVIEFLNG